MADLHAAVMRRLDSVGFGDKARAARAVFQPWWRKRNARDDANLKLLLRLSLPADGVCVDVGANVGSVLATIVELAPDAEHLAYEPVPWLADDLRRRFPQVDVREVAVGDETGEATFVVVRDRPSLSGLKVTLVGDRGTDHEDITVPVVRLDDELADVRPAFVKIDVEGGELLALRGARSVLREARPLLQFEFGHGGRTPDFEKADAVFAEVDAARLRLFDMDGVALPWPKFRSVYKAGSHWNFVARR
jgi:FkbM family methyltransferase